MGVKIEVYKTNSDLAINIPKDVLPEPKVREVEVVTEIPGHLAETFHPHWYYCVVRKWKDRTSLLLKSTIGLSEWREISRLGLDPYKTLWVHIRGTPKDRWVRVSKVRKGTGLRVNVPADIERRLKISRYDGDVYPVLIRGTTFPEKRIRIVRRPVRKVVIDHMGKEYEAEEISDDKYRWVIPKEIVSYPVLLQGFNMIPPIYPLAEIFRHGEVIYVDFVYYSDEGRKVSEQIGYAYRNMAVRNYTAAAEIDLGYPFLCEIRATYISSMPKKYYQINEHPVYTKKICDTLKKSLETTVYNLLQYFFKPAKKGQKYSTISFAEHDGKIEFTTKKIELQKKYPRMKNVPEIKSLGEESTDRWDIMAYPYYRCIKYIRIIGKWAYKNQNFIRGIYLDDDVERVLDQNNEKRLEDGYKSAIWLDKNGFVWRTFADE